MLAHVSVDRAYERLQPRQGLFVDSLFCFFRFVLQHVAVWFRKKQQQQQQPIYKIRRLVAIVQKILAKHDDFQVSLIERRFALRSNRLTQPIETAKALFAMSNFLPLLDMFQVSLITAAYQST